jgi:hypothetical protein
MRTSLGNYTEFFIQALAKLEVQSDDHLYVERGISAALLLVIMEREWFMKHIELNDEPDPWMLNASEKWIVAHPVPAPDLRAVIYSNRVVRLANSWYTLIKTSFDGVETLRRRYLKRDDTRSAFTETEVAALLAFNGCKVRIDEEIGIRGRDYDLSASYQGVEASVEVTCITGGPLSLQTTLNRLNEKRTQVPADKPAVLYVYIPAAWTVLFTFSRIVLGTAVRRFFLRSRRYNIIVFMWERAFLADGCGRVTLAVQPVYNERARFRLPDRTVFSAKRDRNWGLTRSSDSFYQSLLTKRMLEELKRG